MSEPGRKHSSRRDLRDDAEFARSSRSRSPACDFRWDSEVSDRKRMRSGGSTRPCRDFAVGNCRRGSHCHFLHDDNQNYDDGWESRSREDRALRYSAPHEGGDYSLRSGRSNDACINFAKGWCRMGASCKYVHHHDNSDGFREISVAESTREREIDRRHMESSYEWDGAHRPNHSGDIPCKFFAFGNCRNGKNCRFSHDSQAFQRPNRSLRDDRTSYYGEHEALDIQKLNDSISSNGRLRDDRCGFKSNMADVDEAWDGPEKNDLGAVVDTENLVEDNTNRISGATEPSFTHRPMNDVLDCRLDKGRVHAQSPFPSAKNDTNYWETQKAGDNMRSTQSINTVIWPGDEKMSPDWKFGVGSFCGTEEKHEQNKQEVTPGQRFNQNAQYLNASSCQVVGQSQMPVSVAASRVGIVEGMQNQEINVEKKYTAEPNIMEAILSQISSRDPLSQNMVSKERLAQLTSISATLAHIIGSAKQLPQLNATSNSHDARDTPLLGKSEGSYSNNKPVFTFAKSDPAVGSQKQYDPICDSIETKDAHANGVPPYFSPIVKVINEAEEIPAPSSKSTRQNLDYSRKTAFPEGPLVKCDHSIQLQLQGENIEINKEKDVVIAEEKQSLQCAKEITKENIPMENMDQTGGTDEAKKTKDVKGVRAFKYSLVEFVKELLKPTWKEGQITKEDYKSIVKKVADKVVGTVQRAHIPQTQEKIDHYLSLSKPKLNKLLQAYVEKAQKA
ncbi:zinc finger CCCH domain-containing protein 38-like isoform X1 [Arachis stenosperma]|uniref:zinc finger CCCH domain-containing protein 38-like isoform X1 n=1 Tax=Arachis stenosperma TaxID=217475 RepID=UPI0025AB821F|nr:zinc finger CCCH domain-containing protein 38-like isoform X1 [Arachis stenosperma]